MRTRGLCRLVGWGVVAVWAGLTAACEFPRPANFGPDTDAPAVECVAGTRTCTGESFTACGDDSTFVRHQVPNGAPDGSAMTLVMNGYPCPLGCHPTEPRCLDVQPTNGLATALDALDADPALIDFVVDDPSGPTTVIDTVEPGSTSVTFTFANGTSVTIPAEVRPQLDALDLRVLKVRSLTIAPGSRLKFAAVKPIAIVSQFDIFIAGTLDYSGTGSVPSTVRAGCDVGPLHPATGGAGNFTAGGDASTGAAGGAALTTSPDLVPLEGGCTAYLGFGGGALQLVSRRRIALAATGVINVAGRRGQGSTAGGLMVTGGGAGGAVVLEAPTVGLAAGAIIIGRGGSGAAGSTSSLQFEDGRAGDHDLHATEVRGGQCPGCASEGGTGGTETAPAERGTGSGNDIAGGGGAVGRCVIRTRTLTIPPAGTMKLQHLRLLLSTR